MIVNKQEIITNTPTTTKRNIQSYNDDDDDVVIKILMKHKTYETNMPEWLPKEYKF